MRRLAAISLLCLVGSLAVAQTTPDPAQETTRFLRRAWSLVRKKGPKALESAQLAWPDEIRGVRRRVQEFSRSLVGRFEGSGLQERTRMIAELWRIRGSLNLLAMLSPEGLKLVTGLDVSELRKLQEQARGWKTPW